MFNYDRVRKLKAQNEELRKQSSEKIDKLSGLVIKLGILSGDTIHNHFIFTDYSLAVSWLDSKVKNLEKQKKDDEFELAVLKVIESREYLHRAANVPVAGIPDATGYSGPIRSNPSPGLGGHTSGFITQIPGIQEGQNK